MTPIRIAWDGHGREAWDRLTAAAPSCPFEQSWLYGDAYAQGGAGTLRRAIVYDGDAPVAFAQIFLRRIGGLVTLAQILRGPVLLPPSPATAGAVFARLADESRAARQILFWTPDMPDGDEAVALMRRIGKRRVLTGYGSARVDLTENEIALRAALHGKWRNTLVRAEEIGLRIEADGGPPAAAWMLERYGILRRRRRFGGPTPAMLHRILDGAGKHNTVMLRAFDGAEPVAGALFLRHGQQATYAAGWAGAAGRTAGAGTLLLWHGMLALRARGVAALDLGGIDTRGAPGIARFKLGTGATPYRLAGTFV